jgi:hypothetical protein
VCETAGMSRRRSRVRVRRSRFRSACKWGCARLGDSMGQEPRRRSCAATPVRHGARRTLGSRRAADVPGHRTLFASAAARHAELGPPLETVARARLLAELVTERYAEGSGGAPAVLRDAFAVHGSSVLARYPATGRASPAMSCIHLWMRTPVSKPTGITKRRQAVGRDHEAPS